MQVVDTGILRFDAAHYPVVNDSCAKPADENRQPQNHGDSFQFNRPHLLSIQFDSLSLTARFSEVPRREMANQLFQQFSSPKIAPAFIFQI
jgi:hypothetical protein